MQGIASGEKQIIFAREPSVSQGPKKQPLALSGLCFQTDLSDSTQPPVAIILGETKKFWVLMGNPTGYQLESRSPGWAERQGWEASRLKQQDAHPPSSCGYLGLAFFLRFPTLQIYGGSRSRSAKCIPKCCPFPGCLSHNSISPPTKEVAATCLLS